MPSARRLLPIRQYSISSKPLTPPLRISAIGTALPSSVDKQRPGCGMPVIKVWPLGLWLVAAVLAAPLRAAGEEPRLNVCNWSDYIAPDTIQKFEAETGIKVSYDVYDGNEVLEAKLLSGRSGYDVVVPSASPFMARQIAAGVYRALDRAGLPEWRNLDPHILELVAVADPGNEHGVPYLWSDTGIGYNETQVHATLGETAPVDSLGFSIRQSPRSSPRAAFRCSTRRRRSFRRRSPIWVSTPRAAISATSTKPLPSYKRSAPTSANSIPRNTSTTSREAVC